MCGPRSPEPRRADPGRTSTSQRGASGELVFECLQRLRGSAVRVGIWPGRVLPYDEGTKHVLRFHQSAHQLELVAIDQAAFETPEQRIYRLVLQAGSPANCRERCAQKTDVTAHQWQELHDAVHRRTSTNWGEL
jgi:hypothetical protein